MDKIVILNSENQETDVQVIRYFKYENDYFLIFSYGEKDEKNYEKLYIVQILEELGEKIARNITDVDEWNNIQKIVKSSIKQIKGGNDDNVEKLNVYDLNNIKIDSPRHFKIDSKLVELLKMDILDDVSNNEPKVETDYKKMYFALKEDHDATELLMEDLMNKLITYKEKYGELND